MSKYLSTLLAAPEPQFSQLIKRLEDGAAHPGVDVRLTAEIRVGVRQKIAEIGLDPDDTTGEELYQALRARVVQDSAILDGALKIKKGAAVDACTKHVADFFNHHNSNTAIWCLKKSVLRKLLTQHVPHKTMKALHYRSLDSLLKRESTARVYAVALLVEGTGYKKTLIKAIRSLRSSDFELKTIECVTFTTIEWQAIKKGLKVQTVPVYGIPEANAVVLLPVKPKQDEAYTITLCALVLHEIRNMKEHASFLKFKSLQPQLHTHVHQLALHGSFSTTTLHGEPVYWHHLHRLFARKPIHPEFLEPHVSAQDLTWLSIEASLSAIDERLGFWVGTHHLGFVSTDRTVSLHVIDVALSALYENNAASLRFVRQTVWDELLVRYLQTAPYQQMIDRYMYEISDSAAQILYD